MYIIISEAWLLHLAPILFFFLPIELEKIPSFPFSLYYEAPEKWNIQYLDIHIIDNRD